MTDDAPTAPPKPACAGPVYFGDQGIEVCDTCGGCLCCDFAHVDHSGAEYECVKNKAGRCVLRMHEDRECTKERT